VDCGKKLSVFTPQNIRSQYGGPFKPRCKECRQLFKKKYYYSWDERRKHQTTLTKEDLRTVSGHTYPPSERWNKSWDPATFLDIIEVDGKKRIKGAVWLEKRRRRRPSPQ
jgi:hypothetical protein